MLTATAPRKEKETTHSQPADMTLAALVDAVAFAALAAAALAAAALAALGACFGGLGVREAGKRVIVNHLWQ